MTNEQTIWTTLRAAGLTEAGTAGLMGNLKAESALIPTNLQNTYERKLGYTDATYTAAVDAGTYTNFDRDGAGYGLAQWTYWTRKKALLNCAKSSKKSIGDLGMQLAFLVKELRESYPAVWKTLTTTGSVRAASDAVLLQFERPADTSGKARALRAGPCRLRRDVPPSARRDGCFTRDAALPDRQDCLRDARHRRRDVSDQRGGRVVTVTVRGGTMCAAEQQAYVEEMRRRHPDKIFTEMALTIEGDEIRVDYTYEPVPFERIRRITGYLVGTLDRFNDAKRREVDDRVKHTKV